MTPLAFALSSCALSIGGLAGSGSSCLSSSSSASSYGSLNVGDHLRLGIYHNSRVSNKATIAELEKTASNSTRFGTQAFLLDGVYYVQSVASPWENIIKQKFHDGEEVVSGAAYWYRCEEIPWIVIAGSNGAYTLISECVLDSAIFGGASNNYAESSIRNWLDLDFCSDAFLEDASSLYYSEIDNSAPSTGDEKNPYACENTIERAFLPSYKELEELGWTNDLKGQAQCTDYVIAKGAYCDQDSYMGYGDKVAMYWTRSASSADDKRVTCIMAEGSVMTSGYDSTGVGVRPCIHVKF